MKNNQSWRTLFILIHTMAHFYVISCYVISEWRSHCWHYFLVQNISKCKYTKIHQINIKCILCNTNNNKLMFNPSVENTFIVFGRDIWWVQSTRQISLYKNNSCVLHRQIEHFFVLVYRMVSKDWDNDFYIRLE